MQAPPDTADLPSTTERPALPTPDRARWQPLRVGLVNLYRFDEETFAFEDGRLLLRGNNGTGKSRVLALTVPFLLDGHMEPQRVEPDGDPAKRMEWNLLLGKHEDRLGYAWLEFGRREAPAAPDPAATADEGPAATADEGPAASSDAHPAASSDEGPAASSDTQYLTIGCGLRATAGKGAPRRWFFVTDQRVGSDLSLVADAGHALNRDRLAEALGPRGEVFDTAAAYRQAIDRALFHLGAHRYDALVDLLVQLRRPQLSRQLDEALLSEALSESLPPLPQAVIADVADAFRALDDDRDQLDGYERALVATETFLEAYRRYAQIAARRRATAVTRANSRYERARADLRDAEHRRDAANDERSRLDRQRAELDADVRAAAVEVRTLETSPAMDAARELDAARAHTTALEAAAAERGEDLSRAESDAARAAATFAAAAQDAQHSRDVVTDAAAEAADHAEASGLSAQHRRGIAPLSLPDVRDDDAVATARHTLHETIGRTHRAATHLRSLSARVTEARVELATARSRLDERTGALDRAHDATARADEALATARHDLTVALHRWAASLTVLPSIAVSAVAADLAAWTGQATGPVAAAADEARSAARAAATRALAELRNEQRRIATQRDEVVTARARVLNGGALTPPPPHTRDAAAREGREGAPLWQLVDPADGLDPRAAAGYEGALEAAGLLDAWVTPDGTLCDADDSVLLTADTPVCHDGGLTGVLVPAQPRGGPAAVSSDQVAAVLCRIGRHDDGPVWVGPDGRWRLGPLHGRWRKDEVAYLGDAARTRARGRHLKDLALRLAALTHEAGALTSAERTARHRLAIAEREYERAPGEDGLRTALADATRAHADVAAERERVAAGERHVDERQRDLEEAVAVRTETATELGLAARAEDPEGILADLATYREALASLWAGVTVHAARLDAADRAEAAQTRAQAERDRRAAQHEQAVRSAADAASRRDALELAVGESAAEILARVAAARAREEEFAAQITAVNEARETQLVAHTSATTDVARLTETLGEHDAARGQEVTRLHRLAGAGLLTVAGVDVDVPAGPEPWAADPAVRRARRINDTLAEVPAEERDWERVQGGLHGHYSTLEQALLPHGLGPSGTFDDDLFVVSIAFQGRTAAIPELRAQLNDEVTHRRNLLDAREREVLELHLVGEVATQLHELIRGGEVMVAAMNGELAARPTSTGMRLRFRWEPRVDGPAAFADARRRLLAADHVWSAEDREALGAFLQARIRELRDTDDTATWQEHLTRALDYRRWHLFAVEREQEGTWVRLTRRTHGTGSGGEKALALTVPQFAAAAAHYRSAHPHAPRLIALDEAFVGIDGDMRAKCLDLLVHFDLDVAMTSEREWACYPTVPAIAIHQLSSRPGIDAVGVHRWVWNGSDRLEVRTAGHVGP